MISEVDGIIDSAFVDVLRSEGFHDADAEDEDAVEERVITASLTMIRKSKKKTAELTEQVMLFYAVFAEDVPIPTAVLTTCVPSLLMKASLSAKTDQAIKSALTTLLKYNLLKGGLAEGSGTFMHDIVRDYVISKHTDEELKALQHTVVKALLQARPGGGFPTAEHSTSASFEGYVARHLFWHISGALSIAGATMEAPPESLIAYEEDEAVLRAVALATGHANLIAWADTAEAAGEHFGAAQYLYVASKLGDLGRVDGQCWSDTLYRSVRETTHALEHAHAHANHPAIHPLTHLPTPHMLALWINLRLSRKPSGAIQCGPWNRG